jgi:antitoxin component YwqK of YwqJK toxin-antitoxin module
MKKIILILFIPLLFLQTKAQSFKIFNSDTINIIDKNNLKQGLWIYFNNNYKNKIAKKGYYYNNLKTGKWISFYPNGNIKTIITYNNNRQEGPVKSFYKNGKLQEQGFWKINKWIGEYKYFYPNGNIKYHWFFDKNGKRTGKQTYYYSNGKKQIEGQWNQGKENGKITQYYKSGKIQQITNFSDGKINGSIVQYYPDGQIKSRTLYTNGQIDITQSYAYEHKKTNLKPSSNIINKKPKQDSTKSVDYKAFSGTGYYKFVNDKGLIDREGNFKDGILIDGKRYIYNKDGKKIKTAIIKNGQVIKIIKLNNNKPTKH